MLDFDKVEVVLTFTYILEDKCYESFNFFHEKIIISLNGQKI